MFYFAGYCVSNQGGRQVAFFEKGSDLHEKDDSKGTGSSGAAKTGTSVCQRGAEDKNPEPRASTGRAEVSGAVW